MRILGVDPGTRLVGYGVIEVKNSRFTPVAVGVIRPRPKDPLSRRLQEIHEKIIEVVERTHPDIAAVEQVFFGRNVSTLIKIGEARGAIIAALAKCNLEVTGHAPASVKKSITGSGRATKDQVREMVQVLLKTELPRGTNDQSDALAIAICHAHGMKVQQSVLQTRYKTTH